MEGYSSRCLYAVAVARNTGIARNCRNGLNRLKDSGFIVGVHHGDQRRIRAQRPADIVRRHQPRTVNRQKGHVVPLALQLGTGVQDPRVLHRAGNHVAAGLPPRNSEDRQVIRLRATTGEDDLSWVALEPRRQSSPGSFQVTLRRLAIIMNAGGVAVHFSQRLSKEFEDFRRDRSGRVVVKVIMLRQTPV